MLLQGIEHPCHVRGVSQAAPQYLGLRAVDVLDGPVVLLNEPADGLGEARPPTGDSQVDAKEGAGHDCPHELERPLPDLPVAHGLVVEVQPALIALQYPHRVMVWESGEGTLKNEDDPAWGLGP